jgi:hypothetical protein
VLIEIAQDRPLAVHGLVTRDQDGDRSSPGRQLELGSLNWFDWHLVDPV